MDTHNLPRMFFSYTDGWQDIVRMHPDVKRMMAYVVPMSMIPPAMLLYAMLVTPGAVLPAMVPQVTMGEALMVAGAFFIAEIAMVALMASIIQQMGDVVDTSPEYDEAFTLAAIAPTPLWLAPLALFVPSVWFNVAVFSLAWIGSAALIFHGVKPLFRLDTESRARTMGWFVLLAGVMAWLALIVMIEIALSMIIGFR